MNNIKIETKKVGSEWIEIESHLDELGQKHRLDGPACIFRERKTRQIRAEHWYFHGIHHRECLIQERPAIVEYNNLGNITTTHYCVNGQFHRESGPAQILYDRLQRVTLQIWMQFGQKHRLNGPTFIRYSCGSCELQKDFCFRGKDIPPWAPRFDAAMNLLTPEEITPAYLLRIMIEFDREYGLIVQRESEKQNLLKRCG